MKKHYIFYILFLLPFISYAQGISLDLYRPVPANSCENKATYIYTKENIRTSALELRGRRCDLYVIIDGCFPIRKKEMANQQPVQLPGTDASLQRILPQREILPVRSVILPHPREMHYRSAEMVIRSWQNATGWQNTTLTIKSK